MGKIQVVGVGLNGLAGLTQSVIDVVERATVLVGSQRHLDYFPLHPAKRVVLGDLLTAIVDINGYFSAGEQVVILASGDPLFFGFGRLLLEYFSAEALDFYPHLSSIQLAFNRSKIPWQDAVFFSVHGRSLDELIPLLQQGKDKIAILTDRVNNPRAIARLYQSLFLPFQYQFIVCENLESPKESISYFSGEKIKELAELDGDTFADLNVVILLRINEEKKIIDCHQLPLLGLPDDSFISFSDRPGLMTKREIRLLILGELSLAPGQIIWDIGAGTGSVSIEIARLCPKCSVYAIEKTAVGTTLIKQNCQNLQINNVFSIHGTAPHILDQLPQPQRIFIGGSGGNLLEILAFCSEKMATKAVIVLALATVEHISLAVNWLTKNDWNYRLLQVQIARSVPVGKITRFSPLNPVTIIRVDSK